MSRRIVGTLTTPDGAALAGATVELTAERNNPGGIVKTATSSFITGASGDYDELVEDGYYAVRLKYSSVIRLVGYIQVEEGEDTTLNNLLLLNDGPLRPVDPLAAATESLVLQMQGSISELDAIMLGSDAQTVTVNGVQKDSISKAIKDRFAALQSMVQGRLSYETKASMDAAGAPPNGELAEVWNEPANNGLYGYSGGAWVKSAYDPTSSTRPANILFDPFAEYLSQDDAFAGFNSYPGGIGQLYIIDSANNPFPTPATVASTSNLLDRYWDFAHLGLKPGDTFTAATSCWLENSGGKFSAYFRETVGGTVLASTSQLTLSAGLNEAYVSLTVPANAGVLMLRVQQDDGTDFEVFGFFGCAGAQKPQFARAPIPKAYQRAAFELDGDLAFDNAGTGMAAASIPSAIVEAYQKATENKPVNLVPDAFHRQLAAGITEQYGHPTINQAHILGDTAGNPFSGAAIFIAAGTETDFDRNIPVSLLNLRLGQTITAKVGVFGTSLLSIGAYFRKSDNSVLGSLATIPGSVSGAYGELTIQQTVTQEILDDADLLQVRLLTPVGGASGDVYICAWCVYGEDTDAPIYDTQAKFDGEKISATDAVLSSDEVSFDGAGTGLASGTVRDAIVEAYNLSLDTPTNLVADPFHRQLAAGIDTQHGYSTLNANAAAYSLVNFASNPFLGKALYIPAGSGPSGTMDRNISAGLLAPEVGKTYTAKIGIYAEGSITFQIGAYFRRGSDNAVIGGASTVTKAVSAGYTELSIQRAVDQEVVDEADFLQIRLLFSSVTGSDAYLCAWCVYEGVETQRIVDTAALEDSREIAAYIEAINAPEGEVAPTVELVLPSEFPVLAGSGEEANMYFDYLVHGIVERDNVDIGASYGTQWSECWRVLPGSGDDADVVDGFSFNLTAKIYDQFRAEVVSGTTAVKAVAPADTGAVRLMVIGDSITRNGKYVEQVQNVLPNCETVGLRQYSGENFAREGRGGWSLNSYLSNIGHSVGDSPFLFPIGVSGSLYYGNTAQWLGIMNDPTAYDYAGFQRSAKDWDDQGSYLYDGTTGRRLSPPEGAVMYDVAAGEYIEYSSSAWATMSPQPSGYEFSFAKYMERFAFAHPNGDPTHVAIMSGANDFYYDSNGISDTDWATYLGRLNTFLDSIYAYSPAIKRIIVLPIGGGNQDGAGTYQGSGPSGYQYNFTMRQLSLRLLSEFDNQASRDVGIFIAPLILALDPVGGFPSSVVARNKYATDLTVQRTSDQLHPRNEGHYQMGDCLAATIQLHR